MPEGWDDRTSKDHGPVVIEIGMRWSALWRLAMHPWVARSALRMARDSAPARERTWVTVSRHGPVLAQRWRSAGALREWSVTGSATHRSPMARFAREHAQTARWGLWHVLRPA